MALPKIEKLITKIDKESKTEPEIKEDNIDESKNEESKPWLSWDVEMPSANDEVKCDDYNLLTSKNHLRKMLKQVRLQFFKLLSKVKLLPNSIIMIDGGKQSDFELYDSDTLHCNFRQESYFRYLFGLNEPNACGLIDLSNNQFILLIERLPEDSERWLGKMKEFDYYKKEYLINEVNYNEDNIIEKILQTKKIKNIYTLYGTNTDSGLKTKTIPNFKTIKNYNINNKILYNIITESRVIKTNAEIELLRIACKITCQGHVYVMRHIKKNMSERQLEALFKGYTYYFGGSRHQAYECICGSGTNGSILHYGHSGYPNNKKLNNGDMVVMDVGSEYMGYATDITTSFPVNGIFTDKQKLVHNAVYDAQKTVEKSMKPGVLWSDMHLLAEMIIIKHLWKNMKILIYNENKLIDDNSIIEYFMELKICSLFMPHGLGHLIGMNTHDVGGFNDEYCKSNELGLCWLRTTRKLIKGMVITVEPGCYFNKSWINNCLKKNIKLKKYININILNEYFNCGGCRLEDDVLITENGIENFTILPRSVNDIEQCMKTK